MSGDTANFQIFWLSLPSFGMFVFGEFSGFGGGAGDCRA